jgi:hypothetical protein
MKLSYILLLAVLLLISHSLTAHAAQVDTHYGVANFFNGNHRAIVHVDAECPAVRVNIPWRRTDLNPETKDILVFDSANKAVTNVARIAVTREYGEIVFEPTAGEGDYYVYYLPYTPNGSPFGDPGSYFKPRNTADAVWLTANGVDAKGLARGTWKKLPEASVTAFESRKDIGVADAKSGQPLPVSDLEQKAWDDRNRLDPMELVATRAEVTSLLRRYPKCDYMIFAEDREHQIRMQDEIPLRWAQSGPVTSISVEARPGERYSFQIGVYAARKMLSHLTLKLSGLGGQSGKSIPVSNLHCINTQGVNNRGKAFAPTIDVAKGAVQPLWVYVDVPKDTNGPYSGTLVVGASHQPSTKVSLKLNVSGDVLADAGESEPRRMSRLNWLNSTIGFEDTVLPPYTPVEVSGNNIGILDRELVLALTGLPSSIKSNGLEILGEPVAFYVRRSEKLASWSPRGKTKVTSRGNSFVEQSTESRARGLEMTVKSRAEFDGCVEYAVTLKSTESQAVDDIGVNLYIRKEVADYMMGLSRKGGYRPKEWGWTWDISRADNMVWLGIPEAGIQFRMSHPVDGAFESNFKQIGFPEVWRNGGKGGCVIWEDGDIVRLQAYTGSRRLKAGESLTLKFRFLITPFRPIDRRVWTRQQANWSFAFQGAQNNPYINYPFIALQTLRDYCKTEKEQGRRTLVYYTCGQLSTFAAELWALRSLGSEVINRGETLVYYADKATINKGAGGFPWLQEHLVKNYTPGWRQPLPGGETDPAIGLTGFSRWHNYYCQGMDWLMKNTGIGGLYLDGIGYDRVTLQRIARILYADDPDAYVMFHGGNNYDWADGRVSTANLQMEHMPYLGMLWFGEGFNYDTPPDYWLTEISGIPYGLGGMMLDYEKGGNQWRGMVYGMTGTWNKAQPALLKLWDDFGIDKAERLGYWSKRCPVTTGNKDVLATAYVKNGKTLISLASWAKEAVNIKLDIDWGAIGIDPSKAKLTAPPIEAFQEGRSFVIGEQIPVEPAKGWLILVE